MERQTIDAATRLDRRSRGIERGGRQNNRAAWFDAFEINAVFEMDFCPCKRLHG
jgi:hypothetical protein